MATSLDQLSYVSGRALEAWLRIHPESDGAELLFVLQKEAVLADREQVASVFGTAQPHCVYWYLGRDHAIVWSSRTGVVGCSPLTRTQEAVLLGTPLPHLEPEPSYDDWYPGDSALPVDLPALFALRKKVRLVSRARDGRSVTRLKEIQAVIDAAIEVCRARQVPPANEPLAVLSAAPSWFPTTLPTTLPELLALHALGRVQEQTLARDSLLAEVNHAIRAAGLPGWPRKKPRPRRAALSTTAMLTQAVLRLLGDRLLPEEVETLTSSLACARRAAEEGLGDLDPAHAEGGE